MSTRHSCRMVLPFLLTFVASICVGQDAPGEFRRVALVIGNSKYESDRLTNPVNDAKAISSSLASLGFDVTTRLDRDKYQIESDLDEITSGLGRGDAVFFFYAGHGIQVKNSNYIVPIDAEITREYHVQQRCVDLDFVLAAMEDSDASLKVVMLDACRDNPFRGFTRSKSKGLASVEAPEGTIVAFSTAPGLVAADGVGSNSPFTKHLVKTLQTNPKNGLEIKSLFSTVARAVKQETGQRAFVNSDASMERFLLKQPAPTNATREPTFQETLSAVVNAVKERPEIPDICSFEDQLPAYKALLDQLSSEQKLLLSGAPICFPSKATWIENPRLRANIIRALIEGGILKVGSDDPREQLQQSPDPTFDEVSQGAFGYVVRLDRDVCDLKELVPDYRELIDQLDKSEKFEVLPGLAICFPSKATWKTKPQIRKELIRILRDAFVINF